MLHLLGEFFSPVLDHTNIFALMIRERGKKKTRELKEVVEAVKKVHPYEELAYDIIPLIGLDQL